MEVSDLTENIYQYGKIYKCVSKDEKKVYIGSTTQTLRVRRLGHLNGYKRWNESGEKFISLYDILEEDGFDDFRLFLLDSHSCSSKKELEIKERMWMKAFGDKCINIIKGDFDRPKWAREHRKKNLDKYEAAEKKYNEKTEVKNRRNIRAKKRIECNRCGEMTSNAHWSRHQKTKSCREFEK